MKDLLQNYLQELMLLDGCTVSDPSDTCIRKIESTIVSIIEELGFSFYRYSIRYKGVEGELDSYGIAVSNFPGEWEKEYEAKRYYEQDPVVRMLMERGSEDEVGLIYGTWDEAKKHALESPIGKTKNDTARYLSQIDSIYQHARDYNLNSGIFIAHGNDKKQTLISMSSEKSSEKLSKLIDDDFWKSIYLLVVIIEYAVSQTSGCDACMQGVRSGGNKAVILSNMQRRVLISFFNNKKATIKEIAEMNNLTVNTVNFHLKAVRKKLNKHGYSGHALAQFCKELNMF